MIAPKMKRTRSAFSLIEVTVALGIASFGLLAVAGLLPVGLNSVKTSREEAAATKCLEQLSIALRTATLDSGIYKVGGSYTDISWRDDGTAMAPKSYNDISLGGFPTTDLLDQRLAARVEVVSPSPTAQGKAMVSVAWPKQATWDSAKGKWINATGSVSTWLTLIPQ